MARDWSEHELADDDDRVPEFPANSVDLLTMLEDAYPPRCKHVYESEAEHHRYAGKVELIEQLKDWRHEYYHRTN